MKIGIIGSDDRAVAIGKLLTEGGHEVEFSHPRDKEAAREAASKTGAEADIPYKLASTAEMLIFAVPHDEIDMAITAVGAVTTPGAIVEAGDSRPGGDELTDAECLAKKLDSHSVVRALIVLPQAGANIPICGDDPLAKALVEQAFAACNCVVTDRGPLSNSAELYPPPATSEQGTIETPRPSSTPVR
ncbi:MAG TPA: NAD(P)-binding domain-containing protein [Candidatus Baltobacteraceae bacterium]|nr:NAD(P)-binding domain-containing protein [Candidatus Baltobacteraceae bacterium]